MFGSIFQGVFINIFHYLFFWVNIRDVVKYGVLGLLVLLLFGLFSCLYYLVYRYRRVQFVPYKEKVWDYWKLNEGIVNMYYGRIRNGKNFNATMDLLEDLRNGQVVYANWFVNWQGYDERHSFWSRLMYVMRYRRFLWFIPRENFHFVDTRDPYNIKIDGVDWSQVMVFKNKDGVPYRSVVHDIWNWMGTITSATIYLDEAHKFFDSYSGTRLPMEQRLNVLSTGHFDRTINVISQRPTAIHVVFRGNVNVFYKCEKVFDWFGIRLFKKSEFQDMVDETVDEDIVPISTHYYFGSKKRYAMYDTKYMRGDLPESQENAIMPFRPKKLSTGSLDRKYFEELRS